MILCKKGHSSGIIPVVDTIPIRRSSNTGTAYPTWIKVSENLDTGPVRLICKNREYSGVLWVSVILYIGCLARAKGREHGFIY